MKPSKVFSSNNPPSIKEDFNQFDYIIMSGDFEVALVKGDYVVKILNEPLCPIYLKRTKDFRGWLISRSIDLHRTNSRVLRKALRLRNCDEIDLVLKVNAVTLTDNYWVKKYIDNLKWKDVYVNDDRLYNIALNGLYEDVEGFVNTYELTNIGSYEKCWKIIDNKWCLIKTSKISEKFSELFIEKLGVYFGYDMAKYFNYSDGFIGSIDFTERKGPHIKFNYEPIHSLVGDDEDYYHVVEELSKLENGWELVSEYFKIIFMDAIVINPDRHLFNFGILRDPNNGNVLSLAPNFDNNLALISRGYPSIPKSTNPIIMDFVEIVDECPGMFVLPSLNEEVLERVVNDTIVDIGDSLDSNSIDKDFVIKFVMNNYKLVESKLNGREN